MALNFRNVAMVFATTAVTMFLLNQLAGRTVAGRKLLRGVSVSPVGSVGRNSATIAV